MALTSGGHKIMLIKDQIIQFIEERKLKHVFGVSGANIEDLFSGFSSSKLTQPILAKTEYQATLMAMGSYLATQSPHVVLTTSGAGVLNTIPVLAEAFSSRLPFVLIAGLVPTALQGLGGFQDTSNQNGTLDLQSMIKPSVGYFHEVSNASEAIISLAQAFSSAESSKKPSVVLISKNIFLETANPPLDTKADAATKSVNIAELSLYFKNLKTSPLLILGEELIHLKRRENILRLVNKLNAKVAVTPCAKGFFDHQDPRYLGLTGMMGHSQVGDFIEQAEVVISLGSRLDFLSRAGLETKLAKKTLIHLSYFSDHNYLPVQYRTVGDLDKVMGELLNVL